MAGAAGSSLRVSPSSLTAQILAGVAGAFGRVRQCSQVLLLYLPGLLLRLSDLRRASSSVIPLGT
jgi:hypothetical protein